MRMFQCAIGPEVDLDDPETYKRLPQTVPGVLEKLYKEVGYARLYVLGVHDFTSSECGRAQLERIAKLESEIAGFFGGRLYQQSLIFWQEKLFVFEDEIENMC